MRYRTTDIASVEVNDSKEIGIGSVPESGFQSKQELDQGALHIVERLSVPEVRIR